MDLQPYGILDAGVRRAEHVSPAGAATQFASGLNTSRFGFRGSEDLEDGVEAIFRLESGFNPGTGVSSNTASLFDRTAMVGFRARDWRLQLGRLEGFAYELAAEGATDPLSTAFNLPNYASPPAAGSKAPVLGVNPLQGLLSYTYGQLRFNNSVKVTTQEGPWSLGGFHALGGVSGSLQADSVNGAHIGWNAAGLRWDALVQQSRDLHGVHSTLLAAAASGHLGHWKLLAGTSDLRVGAGFDSGTLGNGASASGILGTSTTVSPALASSGQEFHLRIHDAGLTWTADSGASLTFAGYRTLTQGRGPGDSLALAVLGKRPLGRRTTLYLGFDHSTSGGRLAAGPVSGSPVGNAVTAGLNQRF